MTRSIAIKLKKNKTGHFYLSYAVGVTSPLGIMDTSGMCHRHSSLVKQTLTERGRLSAVVKIGCLINMCALVFKAADLNHPLQGGQLY